jgi:hypothetical protein
VVTGGPAEDVLELGGRPAWAGFGRHRRLVRVGLAALVVVAVAVAVVIARRPSPPPPLSASVSGLSIQVAPQPVAAATVAPIVATYRVTPHPGQRVAVDGVVGPLLGPSSATTQPSSGGTSVVTITARPDCSGPTSLDPPAGTYRLATAGSGRLTVATSPVDWSGAVRQACWQAFAARDLTLTALEPQVREDSPQIDLRVTLHSNLPRQVVVHVVDIANVTSFQVSDFGPVSTGSARTFRVRLPSADCKTEALPMSTESESSLAIGSNDLSANETGTRPVLEWSVGELDGAPIALFRTVLTAAQESAVRSAVHQVCS